MTLSDDEPKMKSLVDLVEGRHTNLNFPKGVFITKARGGSEDERSLEEIREIETKFFERHPYFKSCYSQLKQAGYENLMDRMEQLSLNSMRASLPKVSCVIVQNFENAVKTLIFHIVPSIFGLCLCKKYFPIRNRPIEKFLEPMVCQFATFAHNPRSVIRLIARHVFPKFSYFPILYSKDGGFFTEVNKK